MMRRPRQPAEPAWDAGRVVTLPGYRRTRQRHPVAGEYRKAVGWFLALRRYAFTLPFEEALARANADYGWEPLIPIKGVVKRKDEPR